MRTFSFWPPMKTLPIDVWSDIACPWCYVGKRRLEAAIAAFPQRASVKVVWHAFELDPSAPRVRDGNVSYAERLAKKYGTSMAQAETMLRNMTEVGAGDGLDFHFERVQSGNTFDAHRVLHLAGERGLQDETKERFLRAYMTEGEPIGLPKVLVRLAGEAGLDRDEVRNALASDRYASDVRADEENARKLGISGVPFFVVGGRYAVSGAQSADVLLGALTRAAAAGADADVAEGAACGPDGCN
jgi:predicted DsbA family dithiol-disulfide isomerase